MQNSPAIDAARQFLAIVWEGQAPSEDVLSSALDNLVSAYHLTPDDGPSDGDLEPPSEDGPAIYKKVAARFPGYGHYPVADPRATLESALMMGDAIDDIADITLDMRKVVWLAEHVGTNDAHWLFRLSFCHWGRHARELSLYLHARRFEPEPVLDEDA